jgi:uncharacterized delta-60 repeat protein
MVCTVDALEGRQLMATLPPGSLDPTFGTAGFVQMSVAGRSSDAFAVAVQPSDGKIVVAGITEPPAPPGSPSLPEQWTVARYNTDGTLDPTFGNGGVVITQNITHASSFGRGDKPSAIVIQTDGKIVVGGESGESTGVDGVGAVVRYNANGSLDTTFANAGVVLLGGDMNNVTSLAMDGNEIVVGGFDSDVAGTTGFLVDLLKPDGTPDVDFGTSGEAFHNISPGSSDAVNAIAVTNGRIYAAGVTAPQGATKNSFAVVSFDLTGKFVAQATPQFKSGTFASVAQVLTIQPNTGKLVVGGFDDVTVGSTTKATAVLVGLNADLTPNTSFGTNGIAYIDGSNLSALVSGSDGKLVTPSDRGFSLVRYNADGSLDNTFGTNGVSSSPAGLPIVSSIYALAVQPDQNIVAAGVTEGTGGNLLGFALGRFAGSSTTVTPPPNGGNPNLPPPNGDPNQPPPVVVDGPHVVSVARYGVHAHPTNLVITFDAALNPTTAQNLANYTILDPRGSRVSLGSAVYNPATFTVTIHPSHQLNLHWTYTLIVNGTSPTGVTDTSGRLLDGTRTGIPGSNYKTSVDASLLVVTPATPRAAIALKLSALRVHARQLAVRHRR